MQPGLGVPTKPHPAGEAMGTLMYFIATFEGYSLFFSLNLLLSSLLEIPLLFSLCLLNVPVFCEGTVHVQINQKRSNTTFMVIFYNQFYSFILRVHLSLETHSN